MLASGPRACIAASPVSSDTVSGLSCQSYQLRRVTAPRGSNSPNVLTMRSTEAPVRSRASSSNLRAWLSSASLLGTDSGDTSHQRKAAGPLSTFERVDDREARAYTVRWKCAIGATTIQAPGAMTDLATQVRGRED